MIKQIDATSPWALSCRLNEQLPNKYLCKIESLFSLCIYKWNRCTCLMIHSLQNMSHGWCVITVNCDSSFASIVRLIFFEHVLLSEQKIWQRSCVAGGINHECHPLTLSVWSLSYTLAWWSFSENELQEVVSIIHTYKRHSLLPILGNRI